MPPNPHPCSYTQASFYHDRSFLTCAPCPPQACQVLEKKAWGCWGLSQKTVMYVALFSMCLSFHDAQSRPGRCHPLSTLRSLPSEAACKRQFPSPVVAKGRSRLQLVHTVDHQFRRPGTEAHVRTESQNRQGPSREHLLRKREHPWGFSRGL